MENKLPVIVQTIVFRQIDAGKVELLLLKRNKDRGGFWNAVNGTLRNGETFEECRKRELQEETGISEFQQRSKEIYRFHFDHGDSSITVIVHYVEVSPDQKIVINEEHTEYKWVGFEEALFLLKFDEDKKALSLCYSQMTQ